MVENIKNDTANLTVNQNYYKSDYCALWLKHFIPEAFKISMKQKNNESIVTINNDDSMDKNKEIISDIWNFIKLVFRRIFRNGTTAKFFEYVM